MKVKPLAKKVKTIAWIGCGGALGALGRYDIGQYISVLAGTKFPLDTLLINWVGCLFLGFFLTFTPMHWRLNTNLALAIGTGFTGAFTTFSTFSVENIHLLLQGQLSWMASYIVLSLGGGLLLAWCGVKFANYLGGRRAERTVG